MLDGAKEEPAKGGGWWSWAWKQLLTIVLVLLACILIEQVWNNPYLIRPFDAPDDLSKTGISGRVIAATIRDRVADLTVAARTATGPHLDIRIKDPEETQVDLKIPDTDLSLRALAAEVANVFGFAPLEFSGSIWKTSTASAGGAEKTKSIVPLTQRYHLSLRTSNDGGRSLFDAEGPLERLMSDAAVAILGAIDPVKAANYLRFNKDKNRRLEALSLARDGVSKGKQTDASFVHRFWPDRDPAYPRALLVQAYVYSSLGLYQDALGGFDAAAAAYTAAGLPEDGRKYANDGKAVASLEEGQRPHGTIDALKRVDDYIATAAQDGYDSALFHKADFLRLKAEQRLAAEGCAARPDLDQAISAFQAFEKDHQDFTIAFLLHGKMLLNLATFLQFKGETSRPCLKENDLTSLYNAADTLFRTAIATDRASSDTWLQSGIAIYQRGIPEPGWKPDQTGRLAELDDAINRMARAVELDPTNVFAQYRLADTIKARLSLNPKDVKSDYTRRGLEAACRGYSLAEGRLRDDLKIFAKYFAGSRVSACSQAVDQ